VCSSDLALTFVVVGVSGEHLGGWITPGYRLNQQVLSGQTAAIHFSDRHEPTKGLLGRATHDCIDVAWHQGIVSLVRQTLQASGLVEVKCFLTGGDAKRVQALLGEEWCYAKDLVLQGLAIIISQD